MPDEATSATATVAVAVAAAVLPMGAPPSPTASSPARPPAAAGSAPTASKPSPRPGAAPPPTDGMPFACAVANATPADPVSGAARSDVYRSKHHASTGFVVQFDEAVGTVWDAFASAAAKHPTRNAHGERALLLPSASTPATPATPTPHKYGDYVYTSYRDTMSRVLCLASGLHHLNLLLPDAEGRFPLLGVVGKNASAFLRAQLAAASRSAVSCPLYATLSTDAMAHLLNENACATVVCDEPAALRLASQVKPLVPALKALIVYAHSPDGLSAVRGHAAAHALAVHTIEEVEEVGRAHPSPPTPPKPSDVFCFCYTSGSTGSYPKGALITHAATIASVSTIFELSKHDAGLRWPRKHGQEVYCSYLPAAHAMERQLAVSFHAVGGAIAFATGERAFLMDDIRAARVTRFVSVPRLLNAICDRLLASVEKKGGVSEALFKQGLRAKMRGLQAGRLHHPIWDPLVFDAVRRKLGMDRCASVMTASAPISGHNLDLLRVVLACPVYEMYGATETVAGVTATHSRHFASDHVGGPASCAEFCLQSVPDLKYLVSDTDHAGAAVLGRGELLVRGPVLMQGYYKRPDATAKAIDRDGWYHTGDVAAVLPDGTFKIIDRVSAITKTSLGEFVAPEKVENICVRAPFVAQAFAFADAFHPFVVAVVVPDMDVARSWAAAHGADADIRPDELCARADFKAAVLEQIAATCKRDGLQTFEVPKAIHLEPEPFTVESGLLTGTLKVRREAVKAAYAAVLKELMGPVA